MAVASASPTDGKTGPRIAALGPASACVAVVVVALAYWPRLSSVFAEPKLAALYVAGAFGFAAAILVWADPLASRVRLSGPLVTAVAILLLTTVLATLAAVARGTPGAPYASLEIVRYLAVAGVALSAARAAADPVWRRRLLASIHVAGGLVSFIGLLQHLQIFPLSIPTISVPGSTFGNRNVGAEAVALSIPFGLCWLALVWPRDPKSEAPSDPPGPIVLLLALELIYLGATRTRGAWLGAACGIAAFYYLLRRARAALGLRRRGLPRAARGLAIALGVAALAAAVIPGRVTSRDVGDAKRFEPSERVVREALDPASPVVRARLGLWRRTLEMYRAHPLLGVGPGNFQVFFPIYAEPGARAEGVMSATVVPRRAHEDLLERLAETGPLGLAALLALYAIAATVALRRSRRADTEVERGRQPSEDAALAAAAAGCLAALFTCGLAGFPLAMPGTSVLFGVALGCLASEGTVPARAAAAPARSGARVARRGAAAVLAIVLVAGTAMGSARTLVRSYWLAREKSALGNPALGPNVALEALRRADRASPRNFEVALETAYVLVWLRRYGEARDAADRALAVEPHSATAWLMRAEGNLGSGDAHAAVRDTDQALKIFGDYSDVLLTRSIAEALLGHADAARAAQDHMATLAASGDERARRQLNGLRIKEGLR